MMKAINRFMICVIAISLLLSGCASMANSFVDTQTLKGMDVDTVINNLEKKGFHCGEKRSVKAVNSDKISGDVGCSIKEAAIFCPVSYDLSIIYDLETNKVTWAGKFQREHCF